MLDFFDDPAFVRDLFAFVIELELRFAREQLKAGADVIGVGDAAASLVGPDIYNEFVWPYEKKLVDGIHALGGKVRLHICGNTRRILEGMGKLGCDIVDLDSMAPISEARQKMGPRCRPARQPEPGSGAAQWRPGGRHRRHRRMPPPGRPAFHRRRRLRSAARHAPGQPARLVRLRPHPQAVARSPLDAHDHQAATLDSQSVAPTRLGNGPFGFGFRASWISASVSFSRRAAYRLKRLGSTLQPGFLRRLPRRGRHARPPSADSLSPAALAATPDGKRLFIACASANRGGGLRPCERRGHQAHLGAPFPLRLGALARWRAPLRHLRRAAEQRSRARHRFRQDARHPSRRPHRDGPRTQP